MQFKKGQPRPLNSGRKSGSKNKNKISKVADVLAERNICPTTEILNIIENTDSEFLKLKYYQELLSYTQAKSKDDTGSDDMSSNEEILEKFRDVSDEALLKLVPPEDGAS